MTENERTEALQARLDPALLRLRDAIAAVTAVLNPDHEALALLHEAYLELDNVVGEMTPGIDEMVQSVMEASA